LDWPILDWDEIPVIETASSTNQETTIPRLIDKPSIAMSSLKTMVLGARVVFPAKELPVLLSAANSLSDVDIADLFWETEADNNAAHSLEWEIALPRLRRLSLANRPNNYSQDLRMLSTKTLASKAPTLQCLELKNWLTGFSRQLLAIEEDFDDYVRHGLRFRVAGIQG
jgi:hypothetical protein